MRSIRAFLLFGFVALLFGAGIFGIFADTSTQSASTVVNTADEANCASDAKNAWKSVSNSTAQDDSYAKVTDKKYDNGDITERLDDTNFGFALTLGSTINGIAVEVDKYSSAGGAVDYRVQLFKSGSLVGDNKADTSTAWASSDTDTYISYGGSSDLWGTTWTENDIENSNFGVVFCAEATANNTDVHIDHVKITVYYTPPSASDTIAPDATSDLAASEATQTTINLAWTAPGDDDRTGTATTYDLRYSTSEIMEGNWGSATEVSGEPTPSVAGTTENTTVSGLTAGTTYFFALKTSDEVPNESTISNVPSLATSAAADTIAPDAVADLTLSGASNSAITVSWTAPGDDGSAGTATVYDLRYSTAIITEGTWSSATEVSGEPAPSVAGSNESKTVTELSSSATYFFALKTSDEVLNESTISNVPSLATTATPDTTAPDAVINLALSNATASSLDLTWTASGDDGNTGIATTYDMRYSMSAITDGNWSSATTVTGEPTPSVAGTDESMTVFSLSANTTYYFALKTSDEVPNESDLSNMPSLATSAAAEESTIQISGGGAGGGVSPTSVTFSGQAYPGSTIEVLRKSPIDTVYRNVPISSSVIKNDGTFLVSYTGLLGSDYFFALRARDKDGRKTGILAFGVNLLSRDLAAKDIFVPPTVGFNKVSVKKGNDVDIVGYAAPNNIVKLDVDGVFIGETVAENSGMYTFATSTKQLKIGEHYVRAKQIVKSGLASSFSVSSVFKITTLVYPKADFNNDDVINVTDWSVFLFRWGSEDINLKAKIDMDNNGKIDITDFSIFLKAIRI